MLKILIESTHGKKENEILFESEYLNKVIHLKQNEYFLFDFLENNDFDSENRFNKVTLSFDDMQIEFPLQDSSDVIWVNYKVNSKNIVLRSFFNTTKDKLSELKDSIYNSLIELKKLPTETEEQILDKINQIFENLTKLNCRYVSIDLSDFINNDNATAIKKALVSKTNLSFPIFIKDKENVKEIDKTNNKSSSKKDEIPQIKESNNELESEDNYYFIVVGAEKDEEKDSSKSQNTKGENAKLFARHVFQSAKKNWSSILLILFSSFLMVLFSSLIIYSFKNNELLDSVLILIISIVFFGISGFIYISCFDFLLTKSNDNKKRILTVLVIVEPILILAAGIGYLCLYLFYLSNFLVSKEQFNFVDIYPSFIFLAVMMLLPLVAKPMNILFAKIAKLFSKKKN